MTQGIETRPAKINADRAALKQPDDLKAVYDKTFDKLVTAPAVAMENSAKALDTGIDAALARHLHQRAPRKARRLRHADPSEGPVHLGRAAAADEGLPGRRRAFSSPRSGKAIGCWEGIKARRKTVTLRCERSEPRPKWATRRPPIV